MSTATLVASNQAFKPQCVDSRTRIHGNRTVGVVTEAYREQPQCRMAAHAQQRTIRTVRPIQAAADSPLLQRAGPLSGVPFGRSHANSLFNYNHLRSSHNRSQNHSRATPVSAALWPWQQQQQQQQEKAQSNRSGVVGAAGSAAAEETERSGLRSGEAPATATSLTVTVSSSIASIPAADWDACALDAAGGAEKHNPFVSHAFLQCLEESRSACREEGWLPQHLVARDSEERIVGVLPLYLKGHSYGEYVFDHSWANAFMRAGGSYYPKLQSCVPFTPATGPRLLVRAGPDREAVLGGLCQAMKQVADEYAVSSVHVTFPCKEDWQVMARHGFMQRIGMQYHWRNRGYGSFNDFLMDLKQSKRKTIRQERKKVAAQGLKLLRLRGDDIKAHHWDSFFRFYCNTTNRKWGQTYLTREFFHLLGERLGDQVLLVAAEDGTGRMVGGALNLVGGEAVFGRNWGALPGTHYPFLHFEACYYQAIEAAIEAGLARVEAGAQGEHKLPRGYLPTATYSAHHIPDPAFRSAIAGFLERETVQVQYALSVIDQEANPFKKQPVVDANIM
ncbi:hypothetical protein CLOM_g16831 [Closterium sp. NIES-68]|nr:hypothetical protein CLOM_g16831 [Closterium sp. NIES-68]GJP75631.1 hypothetical protein CLOP_g6059 [Closterium sp. NIES-67]